MRRCGLQAKQGDVVSSILFNAALESTMWKWKLKLRHHGVDIGADGRLTDVRYADELMIYDVSCEDLVNLVYMIETLIMELQCFLLCARSSLKLRS